MVNHSPLRILKPGIIAAAIVLLSACASDVREGALTSTRGFPVWPATPAQLRLAFLASLSRPQDLGIKKGIAQELGELLTGPKEVRLVRPMAVVTDSAGRIYVADPGMRGVHLFDTANNSYRLIQRPDRQPLPSPVALAIGPGGAVYITDSRLSAVFVVAPGSREAVQVPLQGLLARPTGLAVEPASGRLYLVDTGSHEIKVYARDGALLQRIGRRGTGEGEFNFPTMIWLDGEGDLLVADSMNFRIQVFDRGGGYLRNFGVVGAGAGQHAQPKGIATDSRGHIYVVDTLLHSLQIFGEKGEFLLTVGRRGTEAGEFWLPAGIFIDSHDTIYIADSYNQRVQILRHVGGDAP